MLNDPVVLSSGDIHNSNPSVTLLPDNMVVDNYQIIVGTKPDKIDVELGK